MQMEMSGSNALADETRSRLPYTKQKLVKSKPECYQSQAITAALTTNTTCTPTNMITAHLHAVRAILLNIMM
jgi:hypothetical protein